MTFDDFLAEAKSPLHDGVTITPKKDHDNIFQHKGEMKKGKVFDVHLHGHHIGTVSNYSAQEYSKIGKSRLVKPKAPRVAWSASTTSATSEKHGAGFFRSSNSSGSYNEHEAANHLARHYSPHIKKPE